MITPDALLVFLGAASLPVIYLFILSRWLEPAYRQEHPPKTGPKQKARPLPQRKLAHQSA